MKNINDMTSNEVLIDFMENTVVPYINNLKTFNQNQILYLNENIEAQQNLIKQYEDQKIEAEKQLVVLTESEIYTNQIIEILKNA